MWNKKEGKIKHNFKYVIEIVVLVIFFGVYIFFNNLPANQQTSTFENGGTVTGNLNTAPFLRTNIAAISNGIVDVKGGINEVSASLEGIVSEVLVSEGDNVIKGQLLARQDNQSEVIAISEAEAELKIALATLEATKLRLASAKRDLVRLEPLYEIGAVTSQEYDRTNDTVQQQIVQEKSQELNIAKAEVALEQARHKFTQREIRSLVDGQVVTVNAQVGYGTSTTNISSLFTIIPDMPLIIRAKVDIASLKDIHINQSAKVFVGYDRTTSFDAKIIQISSYLLLPDDQQRPQLNASSQMIDIVLELDGKDLLIGQQVNVEILKTSNGEASL